MPSSTDLVATIVCPRCGRVEPPSLSNPHLCEDCVKAENNRYCANRTRNEDWVEAAKEANIDVWLKQPGETQWEYTIWLTYRDAYPGKKPRYADAAKQLGTTVNVVNKAAARWNFSMRMQAWIMYCDGVTIQQRRNEILDMNKSHISMAAKLRAKLETAVDLVDPRLLEPKDITQLAKLAIELERTARIDTINQERMISDATIDSTIGATAKKQTKKKDLNDVLQILMTSGALGSVTNAAIRKTTEVALLDSNGNMSSIKMEDDDDD